MFVVPRPVLRGWVADFYRTCDWIRRSHGCGGCEIRFSSLKSGDRQLRLQQRPSGAESQQNHSVYPDQSWRTTAGRKLCWSLAAPPASGYGSPLRSPGMKRSVTMVNAPSFTMFFKKIWPIPSTSTTVWFAWSPVVCLLCHAELLSHRGFFTHRGR